MPPVGLAACDVEFAASAPLSVLPTCGLRLTRGPVVLLALCIVAIRTTSWPLCSPTVPAPPLHWLHSRPPNLHPARGPQVTPCTKRFVHDWVTCPLSHPGEKAKRRDPRKSGYTGIACPAMKKVLVQP